MAVVGTYVWRHRSGRLQSVADVRPPTKTDMTWRPGHICPPPTQSSTIISPQVQRLFITSAVAVDSSHMTASSSASWSRFGPPSDFVNGHVSTMWFVVCHWLQSQEGDWVRPRLCKLARRRPWPVQKRFIRNNAWRGRSKPDCQIAGSVHSDNSAYMTSDNKTCQSYMWSNCRQTTLRALSKSLTFSQGGRGISGTIRKQSTPHSRQITTTPYHSIFTGRMLFLMPNQQCQSTEGSLMYVQQGNIDGTKHWTLTTWPTSKASIIIIRHVQYSLRMVWLTHLLIELALELGKLTLSLLKLRHLLIENLPLVVQLLALLKKLRCRHRWHDAGHSRLLSQHNILMTFNHLHVGWLG